MATKYVFECFHVDCISNNRRSIYPVESEEQVKEIFKAHCQALHFCKYLPVDYDTEYDSHKP